MNCPERVRMGNRRRFFSPCCRPRAQFGRSDVEPVPARRAPSQNAAPSLNVRVYKGRPGAWCLRAAQLHKNSAPRFASHKMSINVVNKPMS